MKPSRQKIGDNLLGVEVTPPLEISLGGGGGGGDGGGGLWSPLHVDTRNIHIDYQLHVGTTFWFSAKGIKWERIIQKI